MLKIIEMQRRHQEIFVVNTDRNTKPYARKNKKAVCKAVAYFQ